MKKTIFVLLALVIIAAGGITLAASRINALGDDVTIKEKVLSGDKKAAEGITVTTKTKYKDEAARRGEMHWETSNKIGERDRANQVKTKASLKKDDSRYENSPYVYFRLELPYNEGIWERDGYCSVFDYYDSKFTKKMIQDIIDLTPTGGAYEGAVKLNDYLDVFPVTIYGSYMDDNYLVELESVDDIAYFQIPIPDEAVYQVYAEKDDNGDLTKMQIERTMHFDIRGSATAFGGNIYAVLTDFYCFNEDADVVIEESIPLPEGYCGIHRIPLKVTEQDDITYQAQAWFRDAELMQPMEQGTGAFRLMNSPDGEDLLMFSEEDGRVYLTVMDPKSSKTKQKLFLIEHKLTEDDANHMRKVLIKDDHILITFGKDKLCVIEKTKTEYWVKVADTLELEHFPVELFDEYMDFVFDGDKLYLAVFWQDEEIPDYERGASYYLLAYEDGRLAYAGLYESNLDAIIKYRDWEESEGVVAVHDDAIRISLSSAP